MDERTPESHTIEAPDTIIAAALAVGLAAPAVAEDVKLSIVTGGTGGVYYPLGGGMANVLTKYVPGYAATARVTGGSVDNLKLIGSGQSEVGFSMADAALDALNGEMLTSLFMTITNANFDGDAIERQIRPCAMRQVNPGPGANEILTVLDLRLNEDGSLAATPKMVRQSGITDENERYKQRVIDLGIAAFKGCSPLKLPPEYYSTPSGGWNAIRFNWKLQ